MESKCRNIYSLSLVQQWTLDKFCILPTVLSLGYPELYKVSLHLPLIKTKVY